VETGRTEVYYENGKINMQADWKDKQLFVSKKWNEKGVLVTDIEFPKYVKEYWDNGKPKNITTGRFYRGSQGGADVDSGRAEMYFESGKIKQQIEWKDKQPFASKQWNENGVLTEDTFLPNYSKIYNDQGQLSEEASGTIEYTNGKIVIKNGFYKKYTPDGVYRVVYRDYKEIQSGYESENDQ
jgi:antitoxin component YwqK of YwqJK toxin-antitoxin module